MPSYGLMVVHAAAGIRGEALRVYDRLYEELTTTLGLTPTQTVVGLRDSIREGRDMEEWIRQIS